MISGFLLLEWEGFNSNCTNFSFPEDICWAWTLFKHHYCAGCQLGVMVEVSNQIQKHITNNFQLCNVQMIHENEMQCLPRSGYNFVA